MIKKIVLILSFFNGLIANAVDSEFEKKILQHKNSINTNFNYICGDIDSSKKTFFKNLKNENETTRLYKQLCSKDQNSSKKLLWFNDDLTFTDNSVMLFKAIQNSYFHGLNPLNYHEDKIYKYIVSITNNEFKTNGLGYALNRLDVLMSDAYVNLGVNMLFGFSNWNKFRKLTIDDKKKFEWIRRENSSNVDILYYLVEQYRQESIFVGLEDLAPPYQGYSRLRDALQYYRDLDDMGGWKKVSNGKKLKPKKYDKRVPLFKKRLIVTNDFTGDINSSDTYYGSKLVEAIKKFQLRHNLHPDGVIGKKTIKAMNIGVKDKIKRIILNLDRYRWLPKDITDSYIDINIPAFKLKVIEDNVIVDTQNIIVGRKVRPTPILNSKITTLVLNPYWRAPKTIIQKDFLKGFRKDPAEFAKGHDLRVYRGHGKNRVEVIPTDVNWSKESKKSVLKYSFVQKPSNINPLGIIKFLFSNPFSVYMHDTPNRNLFAKEKRIFSSGCIRIQNPKGMLKYLIEKENRYNFDDVYKKLKSGKNRHIPLTSRVPIIVRYMTASVDRDNIIYFYDDIYRYDDIQTQSIP